MTVARKSRTIATRPARTSSTSAYDGATAAGEALLLARRIHEGNRFLVPSNLPWEEKSVLANYAAGLLIDGLNGVPNDHDVLAGEGDVFFVMFHQGGGRARVYLFVGLSGQHRFSGPERIRSFLEACAVSCYPWSDEVAPTFLAKTIGALVGVEAGGAETRVLPCVK